MDKHEALTDADMSETSYRASRAHKLFGSTIRYRIYELIGEREPISTSQLADTLSRTLDSISYHVDKLKEKDFIYSRKEGRTSYQHIKREDIYEAFLKFQEIFERPD